MAVTPSRIAPPAEPRYQPDTRNCQWLCSSASQRTPRPRRRTPLAAGRPRPGCPRCSSAAPRSHAAWPATPGPGRRTPRTSWGYCARGKLPAPPPASAPPPAPAPAASKPAPAAPAAGRPGLAAVDPAMIQQAAEMMRANPGVRRREVAERRFRNQLGTQAGPLHAPQPRRSTHTPLVMYFRRARVAGAAALLGALDHWPWAPPTCIRIHQFQFHPGTNHQPPGILTSPNP